MTATVAVPGVVSDLYDAVRAALPAEDTPGTGVRVVMGPDTAQRFADRVVTLAATWDEDLDPVSVERAPTGAARRRFIETTSIACSAMTGGSGRDFDAWREGTGELLAGIDAALAAMETESRMPRRGYTRWIDWNDENGANKAVIADFVIEIVEIV